MSTKFTHNVVVPVWIVVFGFASLMAAPRGAAMSLSLFAVGVFIVPGLIIVPRVMFSQAPGASEPDKPGSKIRRFLTSRA